MSKDPLEDIVNDLKKSSKYASIEEGFVRTVGSDQLRRRKNVKDAIKHTRSKLHQVGAVYFDRKTEYSSWLNELSTCDKNEIQPVCARMMLSHASTRERLPFLEDFYRQIFEQIPAPNSIIDIACGLNPLAIPWMPLNSFTTYYAYDIYDNLAAFLNSFFSIRGITGKAFSQDILVNPPTQKVDLAFILKAIPCLEQVNNQAGSILLEKIPASNLVISFPARSLSGKNKGMLVNYDEHFHSIIREKNWAISKIIFPTELVYVIRK